MVASLRRLVSIPHARCPWHGGEKVYVCTRWGQLKGTDEKARFRQRFQQDYTLAKEHGDFEAAGRIVGQLVKRSDQTMDDLVDAVVPFMQKDMPLVCVVPHPGFDDEGGSQDDIADRSLPRNTIPQTYAAFIAAELDADMDQDILEKERVGRTKLGKMERFLWQPSFKGAVRSDVAYVLVDDVLTLGSTLASLRSYIISNGGTVAVATALAHGSGKHQLLALSSKTWDDLTKLFGAGLDRFWNEEVGHGADCLTEAEAQFLITWARKEREWQGGPALLQCLRTCLSEAAASGR